MSLLRSLGQPSDRCSGAGGILLYGSIIAHYDRLVKSIIDTMPTASRQTQPRPQRRDAVEGAVWREEGRQTRRLVVARHQTFRVSVLTIVARRNGETGTLLKNGSTSVFQQSRTEQALTAKMEALPFLP